MPQGLFMISNFEFRISDFRPSPHDGFGWVGTQNLKLKNQNSDGPVA
jgi:hypothetical protein